MVHRIAAIKGMGATSQTKLAAVQIATVEQLLEHTATAHGRAALAKQLGVSASDAGRGMDPRSRDLRGELSL